MPKTPTSPEKDLKPYSSPTSTTSSPVKAGKKKVTDDRWTEEQFWNLFEAIYHKGLSREGQTSVSSGRQRRDTHYVPARMWIDDKIEWAVVAKAVGRDAKSCKNKSVFVILSTGNNRLLNTISIDHILGD